MLSRPLMTPINPRSPVIAEMLPVHSFAAVRAVVSSAGPSAVYFSSHARASGGSGSIISLRKASERDDVCTPHLEGGSAAGFPRFRVRVGCCAIAGDGGAVCGELVGDRKWRYACDGPASDRSGDFMATSGTIAFDPSKLLLPLLRFSPVEPSRCACG